MAQSITQASTAQQERLKLKHDKLRSGIKQLSIIQHGSNTGQLCALAMLQHAMTLTTGFVKNAC
jgi:hypothetical protein